MSTPLEEGSCSNRVLLVYSSYKRFSKCFCRHILVKLGCRELGGIVSLPDGRLALGKKTGTLVGALCRFHGRVNTSQREPQRARWPLNVDMFAKTSDCLKSLQRSIWRGG